MRHTLGIIIGTSLGFLCGVVFGAASLTIAMDSNPKGVNDLLRDCDAKIRIAKIVGCEKSEIESSDGN